MSCFPEEGRGPGGRDGQRETVPDRIEPLSDGLKRQKARHVDVETAPDRVKAAYETVIAHYEHMHAHRMRESVADGGPAPW